MKIITVPHPTLRAVAAEVTTVDTKLKRFLGELEETLATTKEPKGVGLAAPQVDRLLRIFAINLPEVGGMELYINPRIIEHSSELTFGPDPEEPYLEGCLSIPFIYGPVPRYEWLELEFEVLEDTELVTYNQRFEDFAARVAQHELDHLHGLLFTDYSLKFDLPVYRSKSRSSKMDEIDKSVLNLF